MKNLKMTALILTGSLLAFSAGCNITGTKTVQEPQLEKSSQPELIAEDIELIEAQDTSGRVSAAREAAKKIIADAKLEAARIRKEADNIMGEKTYEAEKKAEELIASMTASVKKDKSAAAKEYLKKRKAEAEKAVNDIIAKAKRKVAEMKKTTSQYIEKLKTKTKTEANKIEKQIIENARKSAADLTQKTAGQAAKIKLETKRLFNAAKTYTEKQKKEIDVYIKKKMEDADKAVAKISDKIKKVSDDNSDAKPVLANSILEKIIKGMQSDDYELFTEKFTSDLKKNFTKKKFETLNTQLKSKIGDYQKSTYLGALTKGPLTVYLWKSQFSNAKNNDLVIRLTLGELDEKEQVFAFDISNL